MKQELIQKVFGNSWYECLKSFLNSDYFTKLGREIALSRSIKAIYPEKENVFKAFQLTPFDKVKVVFYGNEPYNNNTADGLAYSNRNSEISPVLQSILNEVDIQYPEWKDRIDFGRLDKQDLTRWATQGVFLLNIALTCEKSKPNSHINLWNPFTQTVIEVLNTKQDIIHYFYGDLSQIYTRFVTNSSHTIIVNNSKIKVFKEINTELDARNKQIIQW